MITANQINRHTKALLHEYLDMSGKKKSIDVSEFLLFRSQAIQEIEAGYDVEEIEEDHPIKEEKNRALIKKDVPVTNSEGNKELKKIVKDRKSIPSESARKNMEEVPSKKDSRGQKKIEKEFPVEKEIKTDDAKIREESHRMEEDKEGMDDNMEEERSGFDILRALTDSWN